MFCNFRIKTSWCVGDGGCGGVCRDHRAKGYDASGTQ